MKWNLQIDGRVFRAGSGTWRARLRSGPDSESEGAIVSYTVVFNDAAGHSRKLVLKIPTTALGESRTQGRISDNVQNWLEGRAGYAVLVAPAVKVEDLAKDLGLNKNTVVDALPLIGVKGKNRPSDSLQWDEAEKVIAHFEAKRARDLEDAVGLAVADATPSSGTPARRDLPEPAAVPTPTPAVPVASQRSTPSENATVGSPTPSAALKTGSASVVLELPASFSLTRRGFVDLDNVLKHFRHEPDLRSLTVDLTQCASANFQALTLLIQYCWYLTLNGCSVTFKYGSAHSGPTQMLRKMEASDWREVLLDGGADFGGTADKKIFALRRRADVQNVINNARRGIRGYKIGFPEYLSYIVSELLYNATEHGRRLATVDDCQVIVPAIFQFGYYSALNRLSFIFTDLGIGVKAHLEQSYPPFPTDQEAITYALRPNVSGTSRQQSGPYATKENAGMGLTYSSLMLKRLKGDMYIVSHNGLVHVSPEDVTSKRLANPWPGTFVLINLNLGNAGEVQAEELLAEIRESARREVDGAAEKEQEARFSVSIFNYFGKWAEDKDAAITFRDRRLMPAIEAGKKIDLDFRDVETAPHSFLNALLATPIRRLGPKAYQWIRIYNASGSIHEVIDKVLEDNLPQIG